MDASLRRKGRSEEPSLPRVGGSSPLRGTIYIPGSTIIIKEKHIKRLTFSAGLSVLFSLFVIVLLSPLNLYSQGETAVISGQVTDAAGVGLTNAKIELVNRQTGIRRVTRAASGGRYLVDFVSPGVYSITVSSTGYLPEDHLTTLHVATQVEVDFTLLRIYKMQGEVIEADRPRETIIESGVSGHALEALSLTAAAQASAIVADAE